MRFASIQSLVAVVFLILFSSGCFQNRVHEQLLIDLQKEMITVHENNLNTNRKIEEIQKDLSAIENRLQRNNQAIRELERAVLSKVGRGLERGEIEEKWVKPEETTASIGKEEAPKAKVETEEESISDPQRLYQKAFGRLKSEDYSEAILTFKRFVQKFPDHDYTDNALYWLGEIYYSQKNFPHAIIEFKRVVEEYPNGNKVPDALLKIGLSYVNLKDVRNAEEYLQRVMDIYPFSEAAEKASISLKKLEK